MERKFDLIVYGASGFTGQFVALDIARIAQNQSIRWAIAGRSLSKLQNIQNWIQKELSLVNEISIIIADAKDQKALNAMCQQGTIVMNCTGPYRYYGLPVVKACVENKTNYIDITGEPEFIEQTHIQYGELAKQNDVVVISACGFDSIPSDLGTVFNVSQFPKEGNAASVESFITINNSPGGHYTTYECIVLGVSNQSELRKLRKSVPRIEVPYIGPSIKKKSFGYDKYLKRFYVAFPGADASIVRRSQQQIVENHLSSVRPVRFGVYFTGNIFEFVGYLLFGFVLFIFCSFSIGRQLLLKFPRVFTLGSFSHQGPPRDKMKDCTFSFLFKGKGYQGKPFDTPDWQVITRVDGPEPGYVATPIMMVESALTILRNEVKNRGVLTTATAFRDTSLIDKLNNRGITFSVVSTGPLTPI